MPDDLVEGPIPFVILERCPPVRRPRPATCSRRRAIDGLRIARERLPHAHALEGHDHQVALADLCRRRIGDPNGLVRLHRHEALRREAAQRLDDRHPANAELLGERFGRQSLARREPTGSQGSP